MNSKSASSFTLAFRFDFPPASIQEGYVSKYVPAFVRLLITFAHTRI